MDKLEKGGNGQELLISSEEEPLHDHPLHIHMDLPGVQGPIARSLAYCSPIAQYSRSVAYSDRKQTWILGKLAHWQLRLQFVHCMCLFEIWI